MEPIKELLQKQRKYFSEGKTLSLDFRLGQLRILHKAIQNYEDEILDALKKDLNKHPFEAYATEIGFVLEELSYTLRNLGKWMKPVKVRTPVTHFPSQSRIYTEPYGIALIMSPWNYPFQLAIGPLIGAIAAGNCSVLKPSEQAFHTSEIIEKLIRENFEPHYIAVIRGGREANQTLLQERFDYIFFTGGVAVGKYVMESAAKHLTPVTLELGGKSPCIVDETADIDLAARRIVWGKCINAGQTCIAPDYLLVHHAVKEPLLKSMKKYMVDFYGPIPCDNPDYPKIINEKHFNRLINLLKTGEIAFGGEWNRETRQIAPTIMENVTWSSPVMEEEIFGPLLPVLEFASLSDVIERVNERPKPLALYYFTRDKEREKEVIRRIPFGGGCLNDTLVHVATPHMAFGGVGHSGMGSYHGKASFTTFSHQKSILKKSNLLDLPLRYPPFKHFALLKKFMK